MISNSPQKYLEVLQVARDLYQQNPDWVTFFREVLGIGGLVRQAFIEIETLTVFEKSDEYEEIQHMLAKLRERIVPPTDGNEPTRVITVRLPKSLHESLRTEAHDRHTSMNKLCISKLLQVIDEQMIPAES